MKTATRMLGICILLSGASCQREPAEEPSKNKHEEETAWANDDSASEGTLYSYEDKTEPIVSVSAKGWTLKPGPPDKETGWTTTVVVNPKGQEFNIGITQYPDFIPACLWIVEVKELDARFLLIKIGPAASGAVGMPVLYVDENDKPTVAGEIRQRWEFGPASPEEDNPGYNPKGFPGDGERLLRDLLFEDIDGDGKPELVEYDVWKWGGHIRYYKFTKKKKFVLKDSRTVEPDY